MAADRHSPAAASLLAMEIEGNAILKWAGWRRRRWGGGGKRGRRRGKDIEDVKKTMASTLQHRALAFWKREARFLFVLFHFIYKRNTEQTGEICLIVACLVCKVKQVTCLNTDPTAKYSFRQTY